MLAEPFVRPPPPSSPEQLTSIDRTGHLQLVAAGCIALRSGADTCNRCTTICPVRCLQTTGDGFHAGDACLGCGRCAAVCPTGALRARGFEPQETLPEGNTLRVECMKVPISIAGHKAMRVPCLGGISPSGWLHIVEMATERRVEIVNRHWCTHCSAGANCNGEHPARQALSQAEIPLAALGWSDDRRPHIRDEALPALLMPDSIPSARPASVARRSFFMGVGRELRRAVGDTQDGTSSSPRKLRQEIPPITERSTFLAITRRLARAAGRPMPGALYTEIEANNACCNHQLCARLCPTGALAAYDEGAIAGLSFDPAACIRCGRCTDVCPEHALTMRPARTAPSDGGRAVVTAFAERPCARCRSPFIGAASQKECPACNRSRQLGRALFGHGTSLADDQFTAPIDAATSSGGVHHE